MMPSQELSRILHRVKRLAQSSWRSLKDPTVNWVPPGHFYSPIAGMEDRERAIRSVGRRSETTIPGVRLHHDQQMKLIGTLQTDIKRLPFLDCPNDLNRYYFGAPTYGYTDASTCAAMLLHARPQRVFEVGCGWSSALLLDLNEAYFSSKLDLKFIEPFPKMLRRISRPGDLDNRLMEVPLQETPITLFETLERDDVLFIDSTHVSRVGSDVNYLFFEILPRIAAGVYIHFHDVFHPFEYPDVWLREGRSWNEDYLLRAFLQYNSDFEVILFTNYLIETESSWFAKQLPRTMLDRGGNIWLRRCG
jgi:hypothetical protein